MLIISAAALLVMQPGPPPRPASPPTPSAACRPGLEREDAVPAGAQALGRVTWCRADPGLSSVRTVLVGQDDVLAVLADRRHAALWPELMAWAGPVLVDFQRKSIALGKAKFDAALARPEPPRLKSDAAIIDASSRHSAYLAYSAVLGDNGRLAEADAVLETAARLPPIDADEGYSISRVLTRRANLKAQAGDVVGALAILDAGLQRFSIDGNYGANFVANASALLAETGRHAEALALLDRLPKPKGKSLKIGETFVNADGAIQLSWIRACALRGLGQTVAADAELDRFLANAYATDNVRARALTCFGDVDRLTRFFLAALDGAAGQRVLLRLQPGHRYRTDQSSATMAAVRADETVARRFAETQRVLPDELVVLLSDRRS